MFEVCIVLILVCMVRLVVTFRVQRSFSAPLSQLCYDILMVPFLIIIYHTCLKSKRHGVLANSSVSHKRIDRWMAHVCCWNFILKHLFIEDGH